MTAGQASFLFGLGLPLLVSIVFVAFRKGCFSRDVFPSPLHRAAAFLLLLLVLSAVVLLPAASSTGSPSTVYRFEQLFVLQVLLGLFLYGWWLLSGHPPLLDFLALRARRPAGEALLGIGLGALGWLLTFVFGALAAAAFSRFGGRPPATVPPLVRFLVSLSWEKRALVVLVAMVVEELVFRAFLQRRLGAVPASILFLLAHGGYGSPWFFVGLTAITIVLAGAFAKRGSIIAPAFAHGTFDSIQLFVVLPAAVRLLGQQ
ncbi:MAG TPA: CPBP family intramembrane glutamic endopeptidase [Thermoanaerobaculia bacterium]|nr:CPBP family intramembrane glutamic endopeptidase [Thermoanaerobaculia bacterium]